LVSSLFANDSKTSEELKAGTVCVNHGFIHTPHGPYKSSGDSGYGLDVSRRAIFEYLKTKNIMPKLYQYHFFKVHCDRAPVTCASSSTNWHNAIVKRVKCCQDSAKMLANTVAIGQRLQEQVLGPMKETFVGKEEIIDLLGLCLAGGENLFILGPPGTAKSALVHELGKNLAGNTFEYLLTRFTEPSELFGPFDIRKLRDGVLQTNTEGMLPEASLVFLDELLNANSAILNSLLTVLNERVLRRGRETYQLPILTVIGASNHLPQEEALQALLDRFLLRVHSDNVSEKQLGELLAAGWALEHQNQAEEPVLSVDEIAQLQRSLPKVSLNDVRPAYLKLVTRIRNAGLKLSDRRAVKLQRLIAASTLLCGREKAQVSDFWVMKHIWDLEEQQESLIAVVEESIAESNFDSQHETEDHPRSREQEPPNPELLAADLEKLASEWQEAPEAKQAILRDRLNLVASRCEWVTNDEQRQALKAQVVALWEQTPA
jgi:MoxR-like ATPase